MKTVAGLCRIVTRADTVILAPVPMPYNKRVWWSIESHSDNEFNSANNIVSLLHSGHPELDYMCCQDGCVHVAWVMFGSEVLVSHLSY